MCYATAGLAPALAASQTEPCELAQELLVTVPSDFPAEVATSWLLVAGERLLECGHVWPRGAVIGPSGPVIEGSRLTSFYVTGATVGPGLDCLTLPDLTVLIAWLLPISDSEAEWARAHTADEFEGLLEAREVEHLDVFRDPMVLPQPSWRSMAGPPPAVAWPSPLSSVAPLRKAPNPDIDRNGES